MVPDKSVGELSSNVHNVKVIPIKFASFFSPLSFTSLPPNRHAAGQPLACALLSLQPGRSGGAQVPLYQPDRRQPVRYGAAPGEEEGGVRHLLRVRHGGGGGRPVLLHAVRAGEGEELPLHRQGVQSHQVSERALERTWRLDCNYYFYLFIPGWTASPRS